MIQEATIGEGYITLTNASVEYNTTYYKLQGDIRRGLLTAYTPIEKGGKVTFVEKSAEIRKQNKAGVLYLKRIELKKRIEQKRQVRSKPNYPEWLEMKIIQLAQLQATYPEQVDRRALFDALNVHPIDGHKTPHFGPNPETKYNFRDTWPIIKYICDTHKWPPKKRRAKR